MRQKRGLWARVLATVPASAAAVGLVLLAGASPALADGFGGGIIGSPHDFSDGVVIENGSGTLDETWNWRGEICRVCHIPHDHGRSTAILAGGLLWNHALSVATYTMYDISWSSTLTHAQSAQPDGVAKMCLGCHDGTVAVNRFDSNTGGTRQDLAGADIFISEYDGSYEIPTLDDSGNEDLRGTHPLSIAYLGTDPNLRPVTDAMGTSGTIGDVLDNGKVQCSACHDVHDQESVAGTHLLRVSQKVPPSGLCLTCHIK